MTSKEIIKPIGDLKPAVIDIPGSKSHTNRALICAALATGRSTIDRFLVADDTMAMLEVVRSLGAKVDLDQRCNRVVVDGIGGPPTNTDDLPVLLDARKSGTTARFVLPIINTGSGKFTLDGDEQLRERPFEDLVEALNQLGAQIDQKVLPISVDALGLTGREVCVRGNISSQYLSGLMLAGPLTKDGLNIKIEQELVSKPYVELTAETMRTFGASVDINLDFSEVKIKGGGYKAVEILLEPDASAASYFFGAAAMTGNSVKINGFSKSTIQGDLEFVAVLDEMGAQVDWGDNSITVTSDGGLKGIEVDMADYSDTAQTLAVVATCANSPTKLTGIGFIKNKETDRVSAVVTELQRCGIDAIEIDDGMIINPGKAKPTQVETYDDHRMAMSFALLGLVNDGIEILDPQCVTKTFPDFFKVLAGWSEGS